MTSGEVVHSRDHRLGKLAAGPTFCRSPVVDDDPPSGAPPDVELGSPPPVEEDPSPLPLVLPPPEVPPPLPELDPPGVYGDPKTPEMSPRRMPHMPDDEATSRHVPVVGIVTSGGPEQSPFENTSRCGLGEPVTYREDVAGAGHPMHK